MRLFFPRLLFPSAKKSTSLLGCGQFGFSTISFFLYKARHNHFLECYDIVEESSDKTARFWGYKSVSANDLLNNQDCKLVYIASNHASHTPYAVTALNGGKDVYIEKPISVNRSQLSELSLAMKRASSSAYIGYNRPFSKAVSDIKKHFTKEGLPISLGCFVSGHVIDKDHWYREPQEGTRVCGNMGHWIDLSVHLMAARGGIPDQFNISCTYSSDQRDDNVVVSYRTSMNDIVTICLTARSEPFEGINETINLQYDNVIAKIDDFRSMKLWAGEQYTKKKYWPKDVGHKKAVLQPFTKDKRDFSEVLISSLLMLEIKEMVESGTENKVYKPFEDHIYKDFKE
jgi:predicted dehydrogenase